MIARSPPGNLERNLSSLPARLGGLGIPNPTCISSSEFTTSFEITKPPQSLILSQASTYVDDIKSIQASIKLRLKHLKTSQALSIHLIKYPQFIELASEKGASNWFTVLPWKEHGFILHKTGFHDAITLRYGWIPARTPLHCPCGTKFSIDHTFSRPKGGFPSIRHYEICDLTANLLTEVGHEVQISNQLWGSTFLWKY